MIPDDHKLDKYELVNALFWLLLAAFIILFILLSLNQARSRGHDDDLNLERKSYVFHAV